MVAFIELAAAEALLVFLLVRIVKRDKRVD